MYHSRIHHRLTYLEQYQSLPQTFTTNTSKPDQLRTELQHTLCTTAKLFSQVYGQIYTNVSHHIYKPAAPSDYQQPYTETHSPSLSVLIPTLSFKTNYLRASNCQNTLQSICQKASILIGHGNDSKYAPKAFLRPF